MLDATVGRGCDHCETGVPVEKIKSRLGVVELCLECVMLWFPGRTVAWWEGHHVPFSDHLDDAIARTPDAIALHGSP